MSLNGNATKEAREENRAERKKNIENLLTKFGEKFETEHDRQCVTYAWLDSTMPINKIEELMEERQKEDIQSNAISPKLVF